MKEESVKEGDWNDWYLFNCKKWEENESDKTARTGRITE